MSSKKSVLNQMDWYQPVEYAPDNQIVETLETIEDTSISEVFGYDADRFDVDSFAIWCDL